MFQIIALLSVRQEETDKLEALNPGTWLFFEKWQDDASLEKHMAAAHFKAFEQGVAPLLTAPLTIHKVRE